MMSLTVHFTRTRFICISFTKSNYLQNNIHYHLFPDTSFMFKCNIVSSFIFEVLPAAVLNSPFYDENIPKFVCHNNI